MESDGVMQEMARTGRLPVNWWSSGNAWAMMRQLCHRFAASSMMPQDFRNSPDNVLVALVAGLPLGLSPLACVQSIAVINGRPTLYGDAPIAQVLAHQSLESIEEKATGTLKDMNREWSIKITRKLPSGKMQSVERSFSIADAKRANLWGKTGPWSTYPDRMIFNRARAFAVRDSFADVLSGVSLAADDTEVIVEAQALVRNATEAPAESSVDQSQSLAPGGEAPPEPPEPKLRKGRHTQKRSKAPRVGDSCGDVGKGYAMEAYVNSDEGAKWVEFGELTQKDIDSIKEVCRIEDSPLLTLFDQPSKPAEQEEPEAEADEKEVAEQPDKVVLREWCESMGELAEGGVAIDTTAMTVHLCNGEGWREVKESEGQLYDDVCGHLSVALARWLTKSCQANRMEAADAMSWAQDMLVLRSAPKRFLDLTTIQLAELWHEERT
tara:strand:+ start:1976 stop:3289 length:1314 start_codon:yes stop_codon:yes gene_type:complete